MPKSCLEPPRASRLTPLAPCALRLAPRASSSRATIWSQHTKERQSDFVRGAFTCETWRTSGCGCGAWPLNRVQDRGRGVYASRLQAPSCQSTFLMLPLKSNRQIYCGVGSLFGDSGCSVLHFYVCHGCALYSGVSLLSQPQDD